MNPQVTTHFEFRATGDCRSDLCCFGFELCSRLSALGSRIPGSWFGFGFGFGFDSGLTFGRDKQQHRQQHIAPVSTSASERGCS